MFPFSRSMRTKSAFGPSLPRLTSKVFIDLGIWMGLFGAIIGILFPLSMIWVGIPSRFVDNPLFYVFTIGAGLLVGFVNFGLSRLVVGSMIHHLSTKMSEVTHAISLATYTGDWTQCNPKDCQIEIISKDELGAAAKAYNDLLFSLERSKTVQGSMTAIISSLTQHITIETLTKAALDDLVNYLGVSGGVFLIVKEGELETVASLRVSAISKEMLDSIKQSIESGKILTYQIPQGIELSASLLNFRPSSIRVVPILFKKVPLGAIVVAYCKEPETEAISLLHMLQDPLAIALNNALSYESFQRLAAIDPLTGIYNRRFGFRRLNEEFSRSIRSSTPMGLVSFDIDHFKDINDTYGHLEGDRVLSQIVAIAKMRLREGDVFIRTGGEEFLLLLPGAGQSDARAIAEQIRQGVASASIAMAQSSIKVTISLGAISFPETNCTDHIELLALVDEAMYRSKKTGRNKVSLGRQSKEPVMAKMTWLDS